MPSRRKFLLLVVLCIALTGALQSVGSALFDALVSDERASLDFQWDATRVILNRQNPYALALAGQRPALGDALPDAFEPNQFPSALLILTPYALMPWPAAKGAWAITNLIASVVIVACLFRLFAPGVSRLLMVTVIAVWVGGYAWRLQIGLGQHTIFSLAFFLLALVMLRHHRPLVSGVFLAVALVKVTTVVPLCLYFVWERQWKPLFFAFVIHLAFHFGVALWLNENPLTLMVQPLQVSQPLLDQGGLDLFALMQTTGIASRIGLAQYATLIAFVSGGLLLLTVAILAVTKRERNATTGILFLALLAMVSNVVIYHRLYDHVTLVISLVAFGIVARNARGAVRRLSFVLSGVLLVPFILINYVHPLWAENPPAAYLYLVVVVTYLSIGILALFVLRLPSTETR